MAIGVINTGFAEIVCNSGPDTMRITVQNDRNEITFALTQSECEMLADILSGYAKRKEERKL